MPLFISETHVDATRNVRFGDSGISETFTDDVGRLYRSLQREYGRCVGAVYVDGEDGKRRKIGWVFQKRVEYEDARESWSKEDRSYIREVWVTLHDAPDTVTREHHYHDL